MSGGDTQTTDQSQSQNSNSSNLFNSTQAQATGGVTSGMQAQAGTVNPWAQSGPLLESLIQKYGGLSTDVTAGQSSALDNISSALKGMPSFGADASGAVSKLFNSSTAPQVGMLSSAFDQLKGNIGGTASGAELDPYQTPGFSDAISTAMGDITKRVKGVYSGSGRDPSGAGSFAGSLGRGLTEGISPIIASQFNRNKDNQMTAAGRLFDAGTGTAGAITAQNQIPLANAAQAMGMIPGLMAAYSAPGQARFGIEDLKSSLPFTNVQRLLAPATALAGLGSSTSGIGSTAGTTAAGSTTQGSGSGSTVSSGTATGTSTTKQPQSLFSNILGGGMGLASILSMMGGSGGGMGALSSLAGLIGLSDERAKEDIQPVGMLNDGQKVYRYKYKGSPLTNIGLIAQRVERRVPGAVHEVGGVKMVDYKKATQRAAELEAV